MSDRSPRSYPPVGDPDRLDAIVGRGRSLRRRRQLSTAGAGAGGALAVVMVAVLVFSNGSGSNEGIVADDPDATTTTTTTTVAPSTRGMDVELLVGQPGRIRVTDPAQPAGEGTQQCVTVAVHDNGTGTDGESAGDGSIGGQGAGDRNVVEKGSSMAVAEGTACAPGLSEGGTADVEVRPTTDTGDSSDVGAEVGADLGTGSPVEIGCAAVVTRPAPGAIADDRTQLGVTTFSVLATDLPAAAYRVAVSAVSGIGDGCAPEQPGLERENVTETNGTLQLP